MKTKKREDLLKEAADLIRQAQDMEDSPEEPPSKMEELDEKKVIYLADRMIEPRRVSKKRS